MFQRATGFVVSFVIAASLAGCDTGPRTGFAGGQVLFSNNCAVCHGIDGEGKADIAAPPIAGLEAFYVENQLHKFRDGLRGKHFDDAEGLRMKPMAMILRGDEEVAAVAKYVARLTPARQHGTTITGDVAKGEKMFATCTACHGTQGEGNPDLKAPRLTGSTDWYLASQLKKFRDDVRGADPKDAEGQTMRPFAKALYDDEAVNNVVAYIHTLGR
jgi:cytochrome c oxidase subunit 2